MFERRKFRRFAVNWPATFNMHGQEVTATLREISMQGMSLYSPELLNKGDRFDLNFIIPRSDGSRGRPATIRVEAVNTQLSKNDQYHVIGGKFIEFAESDAKALLDYLTKLGESVI